MGKTVGNTRSNSFRNDLKRVEERIVNQNFESAALYVNGKLVLFKDGEARSVGFTREEVEKMKGGVFTHNHPSYLNATIKDENGNEIKAPYGNSFSLADIDIALHSGMKELRAVSGNRVYKLQISDDWSLNGFSKQDFENTVAVLGYETARRRLTMKIRSVVVDYESGVRKMIQGKINDDSITLDQASFIHFHELWKRVFKGQKGIKYSYEKRK